MVNMPDKPKEDPMFWTPFWHTLRRGRTLDLPKVCKSCGLDYVDDVLPMIKNHDWFRKELRKYEDELTFQHLERLNAAVSGKIDKKDIPPSSAIKEAISILNNGPLSGLKAESPAARAATSGGEGDKPTLTPAEQALLDTYD